MKRIGKMIKLIQLLSENKLAFKKVPNGEFIQFNFSENGTLIGNVNLRLKRGWNQLHIDINDDHQGKGYAERMISMIIQEYGYISIPEGRIINSNMNKVIDKLMRKFNYYHTELGEHILYDNSRSIEEIRKIFD